MPPKKSKKKKTYRSKGTSTYEIALSRIGAVTAMEQVYSAAYNTAYNAAEEAVYPEAHLAGRQQEAADSYAGAGYTYDVSRIPKLEPPSPVKVENLMATPERKRGRIESVIDSLKAYASPVTMRTPIKVPAPVEVKADPLHIKHRPDPTHIYMDLSSLKAQVSKAHGKLEPWVAPVFKTAALLPVGESISLDYGPPGDERRFHVKVARVAQHK